ncbi:bifunctional nuclease domain-containing protein [Spirochaeta cellobiosiphila]|uniref:bifunctional nuclease domain-containing protein n=1 Tax=Spirochaeta cellobiosiphila TaxID=504483 RepID=UPI00049042CD|nr:bifunctional nuclease domain-containing protein [Spirochaeta cellobiosiphila]
MELISLTIKGILLQDDSLQPYLIMQSFEGNRILPLSISASSASQLILQIENAEANHSGYFLSELWNKHHFLLKQLLIIKGRNYPYEGTLHYKKGLRKHRISIPISSGISFAIHQKVPILTDISNTLLLTDYPIYNTNLDWERGNLETIDSFRHDQPFM